MRKNTTVNAMKKSINPEITGVKDLDGDNVEYIMNNVNISNPYNNDKKYKDEIEKVIYLMDKNNSPLTIIEDGHKPMIQLHYGDPVIINNLRLLPILVKTSFCFLNLKENLHGSLMGKKNSI